MDWRCSQELIGTQKLYGLIYRLRQVGSESEYAPRDKVYSSRGSQQQRQRSVIL
ncbi:hypothetical protein J6590_072850 [Homalodisca vitripennis]|nr:hypothetical protein J6590_072850 [Homalodisca vitripennis]